MNRLYKAALIGTWALAAAAVAGDSGATTQTEIRLRGKVLAHGNDARQAGSSFWCATGNNGAGYVPYYFTKSSNYAQGVKVYERTTPSHSEHVFTIKPNGEVVTSTGVRRAKIDYIVGPGGSSHKAIFKDEKGIPRGYAYWSLASSGLFDMGNTQIGTFGSAADSDMRFLAFFSFALIPAQCK